MSLDITYYKNATATTADDEDGLWYFAPSSFKDRLDGITSEYVKAERVDGFRAGSYRGYNEWRSLLCRVMLGVEPQEVWDSPESWADHPFYGLINFADNEGCIGPVWSARLAKEFSQGRKKFFAAKDVTDYDRERYDRWGLAFATAARGGFIEFH